MADDPDKPKPPDSNRMLTAEEMAAAFGPHPRADWRPVVSKRRRRGWMKAKT